MSTGFAYCTKASMLSIELLLLPASLFSELTEVMIGCQKHSWRKTILLLSKLRLGMSGILELAGPDCLFENTLHDTFLDFVVWVSQKEST